MKFYNVNQFLTLMCGAHDNEQALPLAARAREIVESAARYYRERFCEGGQLFHLVQAFKAARFCHPGEVVGLAPTPLMLRDLLAFPFISEGLIEGLVTELPLYIATATGVSDSCDILEWWKAHIDTLPK